MTRDLPRPRTTPATTPDLDRARRHLPRELLADPGLCTTAKLIAAALISIWARAKDNCWPSDRTIAQAIGRSRGHVQRCLRQLELAGWIEREATGTVPSGRIIWLSWRRADSRAGAQTPSAPAREGVAAPARTKQVEVVNEELEPAEGEETNPRPRPEQHPPVTVQGMAASLDRTFRPDIRQTPERNNSRSREASPRPTSSRPPALPSRPPTSATPPSDRVGVKTSPPATPPPLPRPTVSRQTHPPKPATPPEVVPAVSALITEPELTRLREHLPTTQEQVLAWLASGDSILQREARRLLKPAEPPGPLATLLATHELLARLPGQPHLVAEAAQRLAEDCGDPKSWSYYHKLAGSVASREHPSSSLIAAWEESQHRGVRSRGAVLATVWKRTTGRQT